MGATLRSGGKDWTIHYKASTWDCKTWETPGPLSPLTQTWDCDIVILAIGFGNDGLANGLTRGYWQNDSEQWGELATFQNNDTVLISGSGDGGLIDAINACLVTTDDRLPHKSLFNRLRNADSHLPPGLRIGLLRIERGIRNEGWSSEQLWSAYEELAESSKEDLEKYEDCLDLPKECKRRVILVTRQFRALQPHSFAINRFIVWSLLKRGILEHVVGILPKGLLHLQVEL